MHTKRALVVASRDTDAAGIELTQTPKDAKLGGKGLALQGLRRTPFKHPCSADLLQQSLRATHQSISVFSAGQPARAQDSAAAPASPMELFLCQRERVLGELGWWIPLDGGKAREGLR